MQETTASESWRTEPAIKSPLLEAGREREAKIAERNSPSGNAPSGRPESPHTMLKSLEGLTGTTVTSVVRPTHYQHLELRLSFKTPLITKPVPGRPNPYTGKTLYTIPKPPDITALGEYKVVKTIGSGSTGKVHLAVHSITKDRVAIKTIIRQRPGMEPPKHTKESVAQREKRIYREASIQFLLKHPHIVGLRDFFVCDEYFCMIFDFVEGHQLLDYITSNGKLKEKVARKFMRQMVSAIDYCHQNSIAHRDLKIENMLVDDTGNIRILDFGLSNFYDPNDLLRTFCGSLYFAAPELLKGQAYVGPEVDIWALGVVLYVMVCGKVPFDDKNLSALHEKIKRCEITYPSHLSDDLRSLLQRMIVADSKSRADMDEIIGHPWLNQGYTFTVRNFFNERVPLDTLDDKVVNFLTKEFRTHYTQHQILETLQKACKDWAPMRYHPIVSLYYLVREKLIRDGVLSPPTYRPPGTRSPSFPDIAVPPEAVKKLDMSVAQRNLNVSIGPSITLDRLSHSSTGSPRQRAQSLFVTAPSQTLIDETEVKTVYLKGLFSVNSMTKKAPEMIRRDICQVLKSNGIEFENRGALFKCEYYPSVVNLQTSAGVHDPEAVISFEIHIVRVAVFGQYGVLFKKQKGDTSKYKNLCSHILSQLHL